MALKQGDKVKVKHGKEQDASHTDVAGVVKKIEKSIVFVDFDGVDETQEYYESDLVKQ